MNLQVVALKRATFYLMKFFSGGFICCSWFSNELFINDCKSCSDYGLNKLKLSVFSQTFKPISQRTSESGTELLKNCLRLCIWSCHLDINPSSKFLVSSWPFMVRNVIKCEPRCRRWFGRGFRCWRIWGNWFNLWTALISIFIIRFIYNWCRCAWFFRLCRWLNHE